MSARDSSHHSLHSLTGQVVVTTHLDITAYVRAVSGRSGFSDVLGLKITATKARLREKISLSLSLAPVYQQLKIHTAREKKISMRNQPLPAQQQRYFLGRTHGWFVELLSSRP